MKKIIFTIGFFVIVLSIFAQTNCANRVMLADDPNKDANWEWWTGNTETIYYFTTNQPNSTNTKYTKLPWFISDGPASILNTDNPDMYPCDGWVLVYRDFGKINEGTALPRFLLYNKYKGLFRLFFFNVFDESHSYMMVRLSFFEVTKTTANLAFNSNDNAFIDVYDKEKSEIALTKSANGQWSYADFNIFGYDPNPMANSRFYFDFQGVNEGDLQVEGTMTSAIDNNTTGFEGFNKAIKIGDNAYSFATKYFKDAEDFKTNIKKKATDNPNKWYTSLLTDIGNSAIQDAAPIIGAAAGIIQAFIGNDKSSQSQLKYDIKLNGTLSFNYQQPTFFIYVPGAPRTNANSGIPLYDKPLGVFNLTTRPIITTASEKTTHYYWETDPQGRNIQKVEWWAQLRGKLKNDITYLINDKVDLKVSEISFGYVYPESEANLYTEAIFNDKIHSFSQHAIQPASTFNTSTPQNKINEFYNKLSTIRIVVKMKVEPLCPVQNFSPVWVVNTYKVNLESTTNSLYNEPQNDIDFIGNLNINEIKNYYASNSIIAGGNEQFIVGAIGNVTFSTRNSITLKPGFETTPGALFDASIVGNQYFSNYISSTKFIECVPNPACFSQPSSISRNTDIESKQTILDDNGTNNSSFSIYPNPNNGSFKLFVNDNLDVSPYSVEIFDYVGRIIYKEANCTQVEKEINIDNNLKGLFLVRVIKNKKVFSRKIIIQKD
jgi:hypothetical protein